MYRWSIGVMTAESIRRSSVRGREILTRALWRWPLIFQWDHNGDSQNERKEGGRAPSPSLLQEPLSLLAQVSGMEGRSTLRIFGQSRTYEFGIWHVKSETKENINSCWTK